ncbi:MAG: DUF4012 domain-containing protein [Candidatus Taylorbacteria bacterium]|nr:DUF4012 domain-containing protein [Candidatus Taylorbacteria bacterium]
MEKYPKKVIDIIPPKALLDEEKKGYVGLETKAEHKKKGIDPVRSSLVPLEIRPAVGMSAVAKGDLSLTGLAEVLRTRAFGASETSNGIESIIDDIVSEPMSDKDVMEVLLNSGHDPIVELAKMGAVIGKVRKSSEVEPRGFFEVQPQKHDEEFYQKVIAQIHTPVARVAVSLSSVKPQVKSEAVLIEVKPQPTQVGRIVYENQIDDFYKSPNRQKSDLRKEVEPRGNFEVQPQRSQAFNFAPQPRKNYSTLFFVVLGILSIFAYGATLKHELVRDSSLAIENLGKAGDDLKNFDFHSAAGNFRKSYEDFSGASRNLNLAGAGLAGIFADIPGLGKLKSAKDIVEAGKLLAGAGEAMSKAMNALSQTGAILNPNDGNKTKPSRIVGQLKDALALSAKNLGKAKALLAGIDESIIPEDKQETFRDFKDKMPIFEELLSDSQEYVDFLEGIIGIDESKKYLLLFNNYSELRPTGGFPGTYGVISFSNGGLENFFVDDVYNLDGQLKENIIPPKPLQHITPTLGMRDSAWFIDFPTSARKTMSFFAREAGYGVDGVIALNPDVISHVLDAVGPIKMPEYGMTLTADNFLESIQEEVEYGDNRAQPKRVVVDLAPRLLAKLYSATPEQWIKIFNSWMASLEEKDILFYLDNNGLEEFAVKKGFGGEVKKTEGDYLAVNFSNIKGSKTDAVTDSAVSIDTRFENGKVIHKIILTRNHNGGDHEHGFYNRQNPAYVRLLLPENAEFIGISGNDTPNFKPLVSYFGSGFSEDRDLKLLESTIYHDPSLNIDIYEESGKKGIGFWMITEAGTTKKIEFGYSVPLTGPTCVNTGRTCEYSFYFQKQPGLDWKSFKFSINGSGGQSVIDSSPVFNQIGDLYMLDVELKKDLEIKLKFK